MSVINTQSLKELTGDDSAFMAEMIEIYLRNIPVMLKEMKNSFRENDFEKLRQTAHKIKSSFGMMGMNEAWQIADEMEQTIEKIIDENLLKTKLEKLAEFISISEVELKQELQNLKNNQG